jgi:hypothetical protein
LKSAKDLTVYYMIVNSNGDLRRKTQVFSQDQASFVIDNTSNMLYVTRIFVIVASTTILLGAISALYFYSKIIDNKSRTLAFFSELDKDLIEYCLTGSSSFYTFLL